MTDLNIKVTEALNSENTPAEAAENKTVSTETSLFGDILSGKIFKEEPVFEHRKKTDKHISLKRPNSGVFFRTNEKLSAVWDVVCVPADEELEDTICFLSPEMSEKLKETIAIKRCLLVVYCTNQGKIGVWPISMRETPWKNAGVRVAQEAQTSWVRMLTDKTNCGYRTFSPEDPIDMEPIWEVGTVEELIKTFFKDRYIENRDNVFLKRLLGSGLSLKMKPTTVEG